VGQAIRADHIDNYRTIGGVPQIVRNVSREQSSLDIDLAAAIEVSQLPTIVDAIEEAAALDAATTEAADFTDDLDDAPLAVYDGFYDDVLEDV
jgi:hypothetical protein